MKAPLSLWSRRMESTLFRTEESSIPSLNSFSIPWKKSFLRGALSRRGPMPYRETFVICSGHAERLAQDERGSTDGPRLIAPTLHFDLNLTAEIGEGLFTNALTIGSKNGPPRSVPSPQMMSISDSRA